MPLPIEERRLKKQYESSVLAALSSIQKDINALVAILNPGREERSTDCEQSTNNEQKNPKPQPTLYVVAQRSDADTQQHDAYRKADEGFKRETLKVQWCLFWATVAAFGAAAYYACVAHNQWLTSENTLAQVSDQTKLLRQQLVGSQGALIDPEIVFNDEGQMRVSLSNSPGRVAAAEAYVTIDAMEAESLNARLIGGHFIFHPFESASISGGQGQSKVIQTPWHPRELGVNGERPQFWPKNWPGRVTYIFNLEFGYSNGFGDRIKGNFCKAWLPAYQIRFKQQGQGGGERPDFR